MECILLKFHWGMKALIEAHFQHEALPCFIENVLRSTLSYPNETSKECIQFLIQHCPGQNFLYYIISYFHILYVHLLYMYNMTWQCAVYAN